MLFFGCFRCCCCSWLNSQLSPPPFIRSLCFVLNPCSADDYFLFYFISLRPKNKIIIILIRSLRAGRRITLGASQLAFCLHCFPGDRSILNRLELLCPVRMRPPRRLVVRACALPDVGRDGTPCACIVNPCNWRLVRALFVKYMYILYSLRICDRDAFWHQR